MRLATALGYFLNDGAHLRLALAMFEGALERPGAPRHGLLRAGALAGAGGTALDLGDYAATTKYFAQALAIARESGDTKLEIISLRNLGSAAWFSGDLGEGRRLLEESLALARAHGLPYDIAAGLGNLGDVCRMEGKLEEAAAYYEKSLAIFRDHGLPWITITLLNLSIIANERGDFRQAARYLREAMAETKTRRSRYLEWCVLQHAAALAAAVGDFPFAARTWGALDTAPAESPGSLYSVASLGSSCPASRVRAWLSARARSRKHTQRAALCRWTRRSRRSTWLERYLCAAESPAAVAASYKS
jgi:tetratricopeptide (TPR) repeat protein